MAARRGRDGAARFVGRQSAALARLSSIGKPVYCAGRKKRAVALTFDDGPGPYTRFALHELRAAHARATFFLVGKSIARFPAPPRRERAVAAIGDHTQTHPDLLGLSAQAAVREIKDGRAAALRAAGAPVELFRPPFGARDASIDRDARRLGMVEVLWDVDSGDSLTGRPENFADIARVTLAGIRPGSIVLFHENRGQTIRALRTILPALRRRHLRPVTVPDLLATDPPTNAQLAAGPRGCDISAARAGGG